MKKNIVIDLVNNKTTADSLMLYDAVRLEVITGIKGLFSVREDKIPKLIIAWHRFPLLEEPNNWMISEDGSSATLEFVLKSFGIKDSFVHIPAKGFRLFEFNIIIPKNNVAVASVRINVQNNTLEGIPFSQQDRDKLDSIDLTNYYTKVEVDNKFASFDPGTGGAVYTFTKPLNVDTNNVVSIDLTEYAKLTDLPKIPNNLSSFTNDIGFITKSALNGYATENFVTSRGYITAADIPDIPVIPTKISSFTNDAGYITIVDLTPYALKSELFSKKFADLTNRPNTLAGYGIKDVSIESPNIIKIGNEQIKVFVDDDSGDSIFLSKYGGELLGDLILNTGSEYSNITVYTDDNNYTKTFHIGFPGYSDVQQAQGVGGHIRFYGKGYYTYENVNQDVAGGVNIFAVNPESNSETQIQEADQSCLSIRYNGLFWNGSRIATSEMLGDYALKTDTLAGYGITDAYISGRTIKLGGNSITVPESGGGGGGSGDYTLTKAAVDGVIGASATGSTARFYNEQGAFTEVVVSGYLPLGGGKLTGTLNVNEIQADELLSIGAGDYGGEHPSTMYFGTNGSSISSRFGVSISSSHGFIDLDSVTGVRINDVKAATVNDISTHNTDTTSHADLFALKVDTETYNTAITAINTALEGKENTGVAQGLVDTHNESATAHETLLGAKADKTELDAYLPLSGGTMTGNVFWNAETGFGVRHNGTNVDIGWSYDDRTGAGIGFRGVDSTDSNPGGFSLFARNDTDVIALDGYVDGTLKWGGSVIVTEAGTGLAKDANTLSLATVVTAGNAGPTANASPGYGGTFTVPYITYDAYGRVTGRTNRTITMPSATAYVTAAWKSGRNWYIKWSNGLIQQGGRATITNGTATKVTFHTAFTSSNVSVVLTPVKSASNSYECVVTGNTASNFTAMGYDTTINWIATGY